MHLPKCPETGKSSYRSRGDALEWVRRRRGARQGWHRPHRAYFCRACHCWHLTRQRHHVDPITRAIRIYNRLRLLGDLADD